MLWWKKKEKKCKNKLLYCVIDPDRYEVGKIVKLAGSEFRIEEIRNFSWLKTQGGTSKLYAIMVSKIEKGNE